MNYSGLFQELAASTSRKGKETAATGLSCEQSAALALPPSAGAVIRAGAGSGKTKLLVERAFDLLRAGVRPDKLAVISFTRKSAAELKDRISRRLGRTTNLPVCSTLHSLALRICSAAGPVRLVSADELQPVWDQLRKALGPSSADLSDRELGTIVSRYRESGDTRGTFGLAAVRWKELLEEVGATDFTALLEKAAPSLATQFTHLLIDEAQDLSALQLQLVERLLAPGAAAWLVGDDDQSIFLFRGADAGRMEALAKSSANCLQLSLNFRCDQRIVDAANSLMSKASNRRHVNWAAASTSPGAIAKREFATRESELRAAAAYSIATGAQVLVRTQALVNLAQALGAKVSTVHEAKGLEWDKVWVAGCNERAFPHALADLEEERRLFYVAVTRARHECVCSYHLRQSKDSKRVSPPSRFLEDAGLLLHADKPAP